jgi:hypothetical protein
MSGDMERWMESMAIRQDLESFGTEQREVGR